MEISYTLPTIGTVPSEEGYATLTTQAANSHSCVTGHPMLPQQRQLIALPVDGNAEIVIEYEKWDTINLANLGCHLPLMPYQGASAKETHLPSPAADIAYYGTDSLMGTELIRIDRLGSMRGTAIAALTISPVRYNPLKGVIAVCRKLKATISFTSNGCQQPATRNPLLQTIPVAHTKGSKDYTNALVQDSVPDLYLIVSTPRFRETLKPLTTWKRQEGYIVDELYFDQVRPQTIKDSLQSRYDNATREHPAPLFILLVGDMSDIELWNPCHYIEGLESHRTDFYYSEFTGDMLPDALIGRISVRDTTELRHVIEKTIAYEKGEIADTIALRRSLLVAGREETHPAPTVTNGQVNYLKHLLLEHDPDHDTICFYNPESGDRRDDIIAALRNGIGLVNYTSHCNSRGWRDPRLNNNDINNSDVVDGHLFIAVNNCCRSNDVAGDCFGEQLLRKSNGGAVAAIGATNETLWEEDYYWSVGFGTISTTPTPDSTSAGAFDRLLHPDLQPFSEQAWTVSQMLLAGNSAVEESGSQYTGFYWEIYLLLGDPSLMPHIGPLRDMALVCDSVRLGDTAVTLQGTPRTRVAATCGDTLMGLCTLDANGEATMLFRQPVASSICITVTRQFHKAKQISFRLTDDSNVSTDSPREEPIRVFPNPAHDHITIEGITEPTTITICDAMGRPLMEKTVEDRETVGIESLPAGIYSLVIRTSKMTITKTLNIY